MKTTFGTILSFILAVASLAFSCVGISASSSSTGTISVQIVPSGDSGVLWAPINSVDLGAHEHSIGDSHTASGTMTIGVGDLRGTASGWTVTLSGTPFGNDCNSIPVSNMRLTAGTVESASPGAITGIALPNAVPLNPVAASPKPALFAEPGVGAGLFINWRQAHFTIPTGTSIANYQSTITVTITGADPRPAD